MTVFRHLSALAAVLLLAVGHSSAQTSVESFFTAPDDAVITVTNDADRPWVINEDGVLMSNMHEDNGSTSITYTNNSGRDLMCTVELSVSSEEIYDYLNFYNDNNPINGISGEVASYTEQFVLKNGEQIRFTYSKDSSQSRGSDCGYIKSILFFEFDSNINTGLDWIITPNADGHTATVTEYLGNSEYVEIPSIVTRNGVEYTITAIGSYLFDSYSLNNNIKGVIIPSSVTSIGDFAFRWCIRLATVKIPSSVTSIGDFAFQDCDLTSLEIPSSVISIGKVAFSGCDDLTSLEIPSSVTSIGDGAFEGCDHLTSIVVDTNNPNYDSRNNCNAIINTSTNEIIAGCRNTVILSSITSIGNYAFAGCSYLTSIEIPSSVTNIGDGAFRYCI